MSYTRVALVTGAAQGIGRGIALRLAADGLDVAVDDIPSQSQHLDEVVAEIQKMGRESIALTCDISKEDEVQLMVEKTVAELGRLDVMIANAGIGHPGSGMTINADVKACEKIFSVNVLGTLLSYKYAAKQMVKQGSGGRIIGASSVTGLRGFTGVGAYGMSKAAIRCMTQTAALELMAHNITVNAYAPGLVNTKLIESEYDVHFGGEPGAAAKHGLNVPSAKVGKVEDVAAAISYLASTGAQFITGQTICMDGGIVFN